MNSPRPPSGRSAVFASERTRELVAVVLLSITAVVTAWTGFQASKWGGAMSIAFSEASATRIAAARFEADANRRLTVQAGLFTQWLQAYQAGDRELTEFLESRFPEPLATAFPVWVASRPLVSPDAAATPFDLPEYAIPELARARAADDRADRRFATGLAHNQRGDDYTALTIGFAAVLFFGALAGRLRNLSAQWAMLGVGWAGFILLAVVLATFPKLT